MTNASASDLRIGLGHPLPPRTSAAAADSEPDAEADGGPPGDGERAIGPRQRREPLPLVAIAPAPEPWSWHVVGENLSGVIEAAPRAGRQGAEMVSDPAPEVRL